MKKNMSVNEAVEAIMANEGKGAEILASLTVVKIRRVVAEMGLTLAKGHSKLRKAGLIAAVVEAMKPETPGTCIPKAVRIVAAQKSYEDIISIGMRMMGQSMSLADDLYRFENAPKEKQDAAFMEVLEKKLAKAENDVPASIAIIEDAAKALIACFEERQAHDWKESSYDCLEKRVTEDYTAENKAWRAALAEMEDILDTVKEGNNFVHTIALKRTVAKINAAEIDGGYSVKAKIWRGKGKIRIYVNVYDANGKPNLFTPYLENGEVFWQSTPKTLPVWAEAVIAAMKAAI